MPKRIGTSIKMKMMKQRFLFRTSLLAVTVVILGKTRCAQSSVLTPEVIQIRFKDLEAFATDIATMDDDTDAGTAEAADRASSSDLLQKIESAFGKNGLGILEVTDIPTPMVQLRSKLLPMANQLANLPTLELDDLTIPSSMYSIGWSHGKEKLKEGTYDTSKGSFYVDPFTNATSNVFPTRSIPEMEFTFMKMTTFMKQVGLWVVQLCDLYLAQIDSTKDEWTTCQAAGSCASRSTMPLFDSLKDCTNCKARLLHYFSRPPTSISDTNETSLDSWCGWHTDHGSLTVLLPGMILDAGGNVVEESSTTKRDSSGLFIQTRVENEDAIHVSLAPTSLGFQIGETIQIQSNGELQATPHAVRAASSLTAVTRESLALFLQPVPLHPLPSISYQHPEEKPNARSHGMSLQSRWRPTFGEFQQATLQLYS